MKYKNYIALFLSAVIFIQSTPIYANNIYINKEKSINYNDIEEIHENKNEKKDYYNTNNINKIYDKDTIKIWNYKQLKSIGTNNFVRENDNIEKNFGEGNIIKVKDKEIRYSLDANYEIMKDIKLDGNDIWTLPNNFIGKFINHSSEKNDVYDKNSVYIYNNYQLLTIKSKNSNNEPVMSNDSKAEEFGMGQMVYENNSDDYMTYDKSNNYILSRNFSEDMPKLISSQINNPPWALPDEKVDGRTYPGQVTYKYTDPNTGKTKDYILIGNETQLRAIGSNKFVTPRLYIYVKTKAILGLVKKEKYIPYYPGDADLGLESVVDRGSDGIKVENSKKYIYANDQNPEIYRLADVKWDDEKGILGTIISSVGHIIGGLLGIVGDLLAKTEQKICGVDANGLPDKNITEQKLKNEYKNYRYTSDANYIVFRDIDLSLAGENSNKKDDNWEPINISGDMKGNKYLLEDNNNNNPTPITISNVNILQSGKLDTSKIRGIGFFGSISNKVSEEEVNFGQSKGTTIIENISIENISVENQSTEVKPIDPSLVKLLLGTVGSLLGGVLGIVEDILGMILPGTNLNLSEVVSSLLTMQSKRPDMFATGSFAGRIIGDVKVNNCKTINASVKNIKNISGGFIGYTEGTEKYDGLSKILGGTVKVLSKLLNIIPGIGLGDLITILLEKDISLGKLIPIGYYKPIIENCSVELKNNTISAINDNNNVNKLVTENQIGSENTNYSGGFIGIQISTDIKNGIVKNLSNVKAKNYAGGFAGMSRDAVIKGALTDLGIDINPFDIKSKQIDCNVLGNNLSVKTFNNNSVKSDGSYAGGFNGIMLNSISQNCKILGLSSVEAEKSYAGGFTGRATIGYGATIGKDIESNTLLSSVGKLITTILGNSEKVNAILSITGLTTSEIHSCSINDETLNTEEYTVSSLENYAGGLLGQGDGVTVSLKQRETTTQQEILDDVPTNINGLKSVKAKNYAGGIAGSVITANPIGILNNTIGIGNFIPFYMGKINLKSNGLIVEAIEKNASSGFGVILGGKVNEINIEKVEKIKAKNYTGGLAGIAGSGNLVKTGGINILGLIKVNDVLSLAKGVNTKISNTHIKGTNEGASIISIDEEDTESNLNKDEYVTAGGIIGDAEGVQVENTDIINLREVKADIKEKSNIKNDLKEIVFGNEENTKNKRKSFAGGFVGRSHTGGLASVAQEESGGLKLNGIVSIDGLVNLIPYLVPKYTNCKTVFVKNEVDGIKNPQVMGDYAGGFFGYMNSGNVDNKSLKNIAENETSTEIYKSNNEEEINKDKIQEEDKFAVFGIENIEGKDYAGGFAGKIEAGSVAASNGLKLLGGILNIDIKNVLNVLNIYIPKIEFAGVSSVEDGLMVKAIDKSGYAGGFAGNASGATIKNSNVKFLKHTKIDESDYFDLMKSSYAIQAGKYAGGYIGKIDIDSAAQVGEGLSILKIININNLLSAINVVSTNIENSNVYGNIGGFSVLANGTDNFNNVIGKAGGFTGEGSGCRITNSNVYNFAYIIGQEMAGGYAGKLEPGNVAAVLGEDQDLLNGLVSIKDTLASLINTFIPVIKNSETTSIPCGGIVRAESFTDVNRVAGLAGGYVGYNNGAKIEGNDKTNSGEKEAAVIRLRSVYGAEAAGGFTGLMETSSLLETGNLKILFGLISVDNILGLLNSVYPIETNTAVYGPLRKMDVETWNKWADAIAANGVYGQQFPMDKVNSIEELNEKMKKYSYGYDIISGRKEVGNQAKQIGDAGGYVGKMEGGIITEAHAWDTKKVTAYKSAGGFVGEMITGGVAKIGNVNLANGALNVIGNINAIQTFVPVIRNSDVTGFQSGLVINTTGIQKQENKIEKVGYAGGFAGHILGGQIFGNWSNEKEGKIETDKKSEIAKEDKKEIDKKSEIAKEDKKETDKKSEIAKEDKKETDKKAEISKEDKKETDEKSEIAKEDKKEIDKKAEIAKEEEVELYHQIDAIPEVDNDRCFVDNLRVVNGTSSVGGFVGLVEPGSAAALDTASSNGLLGGLLQHLIKTPGDLAEILNATVSVIRASDVKSWHDYGININGLYSEDGKVNTQYAKAVGGFAGEIQGAIIGKSDNPDMGCTVSDLRNVIGGKHAGGFFGYADVSSVAEISNSSGSDDTTNIIGNIIGLGKITALDSFRTFIYNSNVKGTKNAGLTVEAKEGGSYGYENKKIFQGNAGGFGGSLCDGSIKSSTVEQLRKVSGKNYVGGFVGYLDKGGVIQADEISLLNKLLGVQANILSTFGSHVENSKVIGIDDGFMVRTENANVEFEKPKEDLNTKIKDILTVGIEDKNKEEIAGGFVGYADLSKMKNNNVENLKQVASGEIAGGFVGKTSFAYLADIKVDSPIVNTLVGYLKTILKAIWLEDIQQGGGIKVNLGVIKVDVISKDDGLLHVNLLGLDIGIELVKTQNGDGLAKIHIGDSVIEVNCNKDGTVKDEDKHLKDEINISLIKANRTRIEESKITGIPDGYDVYGGEAGNYINGSVSNGCAGGFVGYNEEGLLKSNEMYLADVIRGTEKVVGPFSGKTNLNTNTPEFINSVLKIEGQNNNYRIYRDISKLVENKNDYKYVLNQDKSQQLNEDNKEENSIWNIYKFKHRAKNKVEKFDDLKNAFISSDRMDSPNIELNAYMENGSKAVLMNDIPTIETEIPEEEMPEDVQDPCKDTIKLRIKKIWKYDKERNRPEKISLYLTRSYKNSQGQIVQDDVFNAENHIIELNRLDAQGENIWEKVVTDNSFKAYHLDEDGKTKHYYKYEITELKLDGYKTTIEYNGNYGITIINKKKIISILPDTGGIGTSIFILIGIIMLLGLFASLKKRKFKDDIREI